jgi:hypothetical protein
VRLLVDSQIDRPRLRFLEQDRGGLQRFAKAIEDIQFVGKIRAVRPGTIMFPQQPIADITGKFGLTQAQEIKFEHAFDLPMTTASVAMQFRMAAGKRWLSGFFFATQWRYRTGGGHRDVRLHRRLQRHVEHGSGASARHSGRRH